MRFLPVFLDLQSGKVLLVGAGDLARAKLRLLAAAGAGIRWFATDGNQDVSGLEAREVSPAQARRHPPKRWGLPTNRERPAGTAFDTPLPNLGG